RGVLALFEDIQASERTGELLNQVARQLLSVKKRLGSITSEIEVAKSTFIFGRQFRTPKIYVKDFGDRRLALKRIAHESEAYEIGTQHYRNVISELLSKISRLRSGQPVYTDEEDRLPIGAINAITGDHKFPQRDKALDRDGSPIPILWRT
ncbi:hypothetical protein N7508_008395, partial [Penicillium antarcticum]|uniref:uncharacterized protein n=1 Tax=Penicillium antarcticum TaxID=416450 RepID=UPI002393E1BC